MASVLIHFGLGLGTASAQARRALVVGINNYEPTYINQPLSCCINDATEIRDTVMLGDPMLRWVSGNIQFKTDSQATKTAIRSALQTLASQSMPGDVVVYYQSSHGGGSGLNTFICTYNAHYTDAELGADLALFRSGVKVVVILDACNSAGMFKGEIPVWKFAENALASCLTTKEQTAKGLGVSVPKDFGSNIAFMTACDYDESSWEGSSHGIYTAGLLGGCWNPSVDVNVDGLLQFQELHSHAADSCSGMQTSQSLNTNLLSLLVARNVEGNGGDETAVLSPVYRFWSPVFSGHFFTMNETEKNNIIATLSAYWTYEGVAYDAYTGQAAGTLPVYRFWSPVFAGHFYTMNEEEKNNIISGLSAYWTYEGVAWYACPTPVAGTVPVYRFWSPVFAHHFFTINETEKNNIIAGLSAYWTYEGIAYYAFSSRSGSDSRAVDSLFDERDFAAVQKSADAIVTGSEVAAPVNVIQTLNGSSTGLGDMVFPMSFAGGAVKAYVYDATADQWTCVVSNSNAQAEAVFTGVQPDRDYRFEVWSDDSAGSDAEALHSSSFVWKLDPPPTLNSDVTLSDGDGVVGAPVARLKTPTTDGTLTLKLYSSSQGVVQTLTGVVGGETVELSIPEWNRWFWVGGWRDTDNALVMSLWMRSEAESLSTKNTKR